MGTPIRTIAAGAALLLLPGCGEDKPAPAPVEDAATMTPGEYEIASEVTKLQSTDKSTPATSARMGDKTTSRACIAKDGTIDTAMFIEAGDKCSAQSNYARNGRLSIQYTCSRAGKGPVYPAVDGNFTADGFEALVTTGTAFSANGDYAMTRHLTARRVGDCPAAPAAPAVPTAG